ncbi:hypothetical protein [Egicoccus sp. AB-alg2]
MVRIPSGRRGMPPRRFTLVHRGARLTDEEIEVLVDGLRKMGTS